MHFATRFRLFFFGLLPLLAGFMASSCQSSRPSFSFQPAPYRASLAAAPSQRSSVTDSTALPATMTAAAVAAPVPAAMGAIRRAARLATALQRLPAATLADPTVAALAPRPQADAHRWPRVLRQRATHGAAESGLGRVALFFIGVVLAILAGLGALFALIPGVSFFGGVGLAAAALVVLFLLYSLVSGGKKKKA